MAGSNIKKNNIFQRPAKDSYGQQQEMQRSIIKQDKQKYTDKILAIEQKYEDKLNQLKEEIKCKVI